MNRTIAGLLVVGDQVIVGGNRGKPYIAFKAGGRGDVTGKSELWNNGLGPDVPTSATDGKLLYSWGTFGTFPGGFWGVHQFSVDSEGNLYTADVHIGRPQKFKPKAGANPANLIGRYFPVAKP